MHYAEVAKLLVPMDSLVLPVNICSCLGFLRIHTCIYSCVSRSLKCYLPVPLGMIPHKTKRGAEAMNRLKVFDGVPHPYDKVSYTMADTSYSYRLLS